MSAEGSQQQDMQINPQRAKQLVENAGRVAQQINAANTTGRNVSLCFVVPARLSNEYCQLVLHDDQEHSSLQWATNSRKPPRCYIPGFLNLG